MEIINPEDQARKVRQAHQEIQDHKSRLNHQEVEVKQELMNLRRLFEDSPGWLQFLARWLYSIQIAGLEAKLEEIIDQRKELQSSEIVGRTLVNYFDRHNR